MEAVRTVSQADTAVQSEIEMAVLSLMLELLLVADN